MSKTVPDFSLIRSVMAGLEPSPNVQPNEIISLDRAFFPAGHRGVLDLRRQLVVGNRGMGKSFWTHALTDQKVRDRVSYEYSHPSLRKLTVFIGFNGSQKTSHTTPSVDEIIALLGKGTEPEQIWRAVLIRIVNPDRLSSSLEQITKELRTDPTLYSRELSAADDKLLQRDHNFLIVFDALDRLGPGWGEIRRLTRALLTLAVGVQSFRAIRMKIFMRVDQFSDDDLFHFPDSSKIRNDHVSLVWHPSELYGLLLFELIRDPRSRLQMNIIAENEGLPARTSPGWSKVDDQERIIKTIAGEFMGTSKKRGRVYTWVPLHLSDAADTCSPRSFLIAWKKAAEHEPAPIGRSVDHLGLADGVRSASSSRLVELYEDYLWIKPALETLRRQFVPLDRERLFDLWRQADVVGTIRRKGTSDPKSMPVKFTEGEDLSALLGAMRDVGVMEERSNGKVNVPDIFRVEAQILRKGGVAVPRRAS